MRTRFGAVLNVVSSTRKLKLLAATVGTVLLATAGVANADTIQITYSIGYSAIWGGTTGAPGLTSDLPSSPYNQTIVLNGAAVGPENFFVAAPPSGGCPWSMSSTSCYQNNMTDKGTITVNFTFDDTTTGKTNTAMATGTYLAKYSGSYLGCSGKSGSGQSDCVDWSSAGTSPGGSETLTVALGTDTLDVTLFNAQDWQITPQIEYQLTGPSQTPLPGALPLFVSGCGVLGIFEWRRKKRLGKNRKASA